MKSHIARKHSNAVAEERAEEMMDEGLKEVKNLGIFQEFPDGILLTGDEQLERDWPFEEDLIVGMGLDFIPDKFGAGGLVFDSENSNVCPVDLREEDDTSWEDDYHFDLYCFSINDF